MLRSVPSKNNLTESIEVHEELNPKIWNTDNTIKEEVATKLKEISDEFLKYIEIPLNIVDIEVVGSNASYNYNANSDIDLHIIVNNEVNYVDPEILRMLYNSKKNSFNDNYELSIHNIPVELYIEDVKDGNATNGRYSLLNNEWVMFPEPLTYEIPDISGELEKREAECIEALSSNNADEILKLVNDIYMDRKIGLALDGEASVGNLVFKELRNQDMIPKLKEHYYEIRSKELSENKTLKESKSISEDERKVISDGLLDLLNTTNTDDPITAIDSVAVTDYIVTNDILIQPLGENNKEVQFAMKLNKAKLAYSFMICGVFSGFIEFLESNKWSIAFAGDVVKS